MVSWACKQRERSGVSDARWGRRQADRPKDELELCGKTLSCIENQLDNAHEYHEIDGPVVWVAGGYVAAGLKVEGSVRGKKMRVAAPRHDRVPHLRSCASLSEVPSDQNLTETRSNGKTRNN